MAVKRSQSVTLWALLAVAAIAGIWAMRSQAPVGSVASLGWEAMAAERCDLNEGGGPREGITEAWCSMEVRSIALLTPQGKEVAMEVLVAAEPVQRQAGYQAIDSELVKATATLFLFPHPTFGGFHMCNVTAPLWIVWYREDGSVLDAQRMLPGERVPAALCRDIYAPRRAGRYQYALEIGEELVRELGLGPRQLGEYRLRLEPWMGQSK